MRPSPVSEARGKTLLGGGSGQTATKARHPTREIAPRRRHDLEQTVRARPGDGSGIEPALLAHDRIDEQGIQFVDRGPLEHGVEVLSGLEEGEEIVTSAQFLIDSESNLRAAITSLLASRGGHRH